MPSPKRLPVLSERQEQVISLLAQDLSTKQIAAQLHLSESTVKKHFSKAFKKLGANTPAGAVFKRYCPGCRLDT